MGRKRRSALDWYKHHLGSAQDAAEQHARAHFDPIFQRQRDRVKAAETAYRSALQAEPWLSSVLSWFGRQSEYRRDVLEPRKLEHDDACRSLREIERQADDAISAARAKGALDYESARATRRSEREAQAERGALRREESKIRRLERSKNLRGASRGLREWLISIVTGEGDELRCYLCGAPLTRDRAHLEHRKPISRGGGNRRENLALACQACNLQKGRMTEEEFRRRREK